ncbi:MAG: helix-turn-helix transcriptional regulator [Clostridia bacterium]|nr:helix-turn-helix transcriptional regulator [Clostridia bacterium]
MLNGTTKNRILKDALNLSGFFFGGYKTSFEKDLVFENGQHITLLFAESGSFSIQYQGLSLSVEENYLCFVPPSVNCVFTAKNQRTRIFVCAFSLVSRIPLDLFDKTFFASGLKLPLLKRLTRATTLAFPNGDASIVEKIDATDEHMIKNCLEMLVMECSNTTEKSSIDLNYPLSGKGQTAKTAMKILDYLSANLHRNVSLEEIADELFFSVSYVKTAFKKHTGKSVMKAFNELKITRAKNLIKQGIPFNQIAKQLAFSSEQYFSKVFKSVSSLTPSEYKKTLIK